MVKFCIIMATYYRPDGSSKNYLNNSIQSIVDQLHTDWDLIVVSDNYEKYDELEAIINKYRSDTHKIVLLQNTNTERDSVNILSKKDLWKCAGAESINMGLRYARQNDYTYYAHLDDDDMWTNSHLKELSDTYEQYNNCIFAFTKSSYLGNELPTHTIAVYPNNMLPLRNNIVHSSISMNIKILQYEYTTPLTGTFKNDPSDAVILDYIKGFLLSHEEYCSIYLSKLTCIHNEEQKLLKTVIEKPLSLLAVETIATQLKTFHHHYYILLDIINNIKKDKINYVEIGCYNGGSACLVLTNPNVVCYSIDTAEFFSKEHVINTINTLRPNSNFNFIQGKSTVVYNQLPINEIDVLFIDGDHSYNGVIKDFELYSPKVVSGGFIVFDDYFDNHHSPEVFSAVNDIVKSLNSNMYKPHNFLFNKYNAHPSDLKFLNEFIIEKN